MEPDPLPRSAILAARPRRLSVVVPFYNEDRSVRELHSRVTASCREQVGDDYEIVLVNDGSTDSTWAIIAELASRDPHVVGLKLSRNHGHQLALTAGLGICAGRRILILDGDLQDPPELLGDMMKLMDAGADVVYGQRASRAGESWFKRATATIFYRMLQSLTDIRIPVDSGDFRLMSRRALDVLNSMPEEHRFIRGMVSWIGLEQVPIVYHRQRRQAGASRYPLVKMLNLAADAITGFSIRPLRLASYLGIIASVIGIGLLGYALVSWLLHQTVQGWTSIMAAVLLLGSAQLLVLGVIGEYLGRLYVQAKNRPLYVVEEIVRGRDAGSEAGEELAAPLVGHPDHPSDIWQASSTTEPISGR